MVMDNVPGATASERLTDFDWTGELLSLTDAVKVDVPTAVGVPEIVPFAAIDKPAGREPLVMDQV